MHFGDDWWKTYYYYYYRLQITDYRLQIITVLGEILYIQLAKCPFTWLQMIVATVEVKVSWFVICFTHSFLRQGVVKAEGGLNRKTKMSPKYTPDNIFLFSAILLGLIHSKEQQKSKPSAEKEDEISFDLC